MKTHNKLVRDNIVHIIQQNGGKASTRQLTLNSEFTAALASKLVEEAAEFKADLSLEELADVQEVIDTLVDVLGYSKKDLESAQADKRSRSGGFSQRTYLISTEG